jgi:putative flavoprotein involved in K+ transport
MFEGSRHSCIPGVSEPSEVIVVGGGQAGLTGGYYLRQAGIPFLILDAASRGGESWRQRWDSLTVFTCAAYSALPGLPFPGDPRRFPGKDEVADYLDAYARELELPIRRGTRVAELSPTHDGYRITTDSDVLQARQVIVATGAYQDPYVPPAAHGLAGQVTQLHSAAYRTPSQIPAGTVLVVGSAHSGCQIAADLAAGGHRVHLSRGRWLPTLPYRILGKSLDWWGDKLGLIAAPVKSSPRSRHQRGDLLIGTNPRRLARRHGIQLHDRAIAADGTTVLFADGTTLDVDTVIWTTGYRADYSWIHLPVLDEYGLPRHRRGVTDRSGLYFLGMHNQHSRGSSLIYFVRDDAAYLVEQIRSTRGAAQNR